MDNDIDITADLVDGSEGALGDVPPNSFQGTPVTPPGSQPAHGDAKPVSERPSKVDTSELSLRDQLTSAFKGTDNKPTDQAQAQTVQDQQQAPALTKDSDGKYRNADGTFANQAQIEAFTGAQAPTEQNTQQQQSPTLQGLTPVEQQQFQSLPAELRQFVERTMEGLNTRASRYGEYDQIEQHIIGPRRAAFASDGTNPVVALNQLFQLSDFAGRDPSNFVMWFADQHKLDLDALLDARDAQQSGDPMVRQLQGQVQQLSQVIQSDEQRRQQQAHESRLNDVQTFAVEKDAGGALKRPYLTDVMDDWMAHIGALRTANPNMPNQEVLDRAYQNACWGNPNVRAKMQQASEAATRQQTVQRTQTAKAAGSTITGGPSSTTTADPRGSDLSLREELQRNFDQQRA